MVSMNVKKSWRPWAYAGIALLIAVVAGSVASSGKGSIDAEGSFHPGELTPLRAWLVAVSAAGVLAAILFVWQAVQELWAALDDGARSVGVLAGLSLLGVLGIMGAIVTPDTDGRDRSEVRGPTPRAGSQAAPRSRLSPKSTGREWAAASPADRLMVCKQVSRNMERSGASVTPSFLCEALSEYFDGAGMQDSIADIAGLCAASAGY